MLDLDTRRLFAAASMALRYPELDWLSTFISKEEDLSALPERGGAALQALVRYFEATTLTDLQVSYVDTFDRRRRACLYMSYYLNGDTRKRGMALLHFKQTFANEGWSSTSEELDDFLPILLEFIAVTASPAGMALLQEHRAGLVILHTALRDAESPYAELIETLVNRVPFQENESALKLIEMGPPVEMVGLAPYGEDREPKVGATC